MMRMRKAELLVTKGEIRGKRSVGGQKIIPGWCKKVKVVFI